MKRRRIKAGKTLLALVALVALLLLASTSLAEPGGAYDLSWWTVDGGGGAIGGVVYTLNGSAAQPDAGPALASGDYTLVGGFWNGAGIAPAPGMPSIYLPLVVRNH